MEQMKSDMDSNLGKMMGKMLSMMGMEPQDILTEEEVDRLLRATFNKFDKDSSKLLELPEFKKAWKFLDLNGDEDAIETAWSDIDTDGSGKINLIEFMNAVKSNRSTELNLSMLITQMDGHLAGMDDFFKNYKLRLE